MNQELKKNILIIDDDKKLLDGIKRLMRSKKADWNVNFIMGGRDAIEFIKVNKIDLILTDMKMPEYNGYEVLKFISTNQPGCLRFILSGQADKSDILKVIPLANQFIQKPCSVNDIISKIEQALNAIEMINLNESFNTGTSTNLLERINQNVFLCYGKNLDKLKKLLSISNILDEKIINIILKDIGITSKIMQIYLSDFYKNYNKEFNLKQAINSIGKDELTKIVNDDSVFIVANTFEEKLLDRVHNIYSEAKDLNEDDKTLLALSFSASVVSQFSQYQFDTKSLNSLSFHICSLWGISTEALVNSFTSLINKMK